MQLKHPFCISARLLPALKIGDSYLSLAYAGCENGRIRYNYYLDTSDFEYEGDDLQSGAGGGSLEEGFCSLLSFMGACAESRNYGVGERADLFPENVGEWCEENSNEIQLMEILLEDKEEDLIIE